MPAAAALLLAEVAPVVRLDGRFDYTLDDSCTRIVRASRSAEKHYGLAPGVAAASFPGVHLLLPAALPRTGFGALGPTVLDPLAPTLPDGVRLGRLARR